jgi:trans-L-3-hydroxyproline dehydratase
MRKKMLENWRWEPPGDWRVIETIDLHTGGEPLRVFTRGLPEIKGRTILEKRRFFRDKYDYIRKGAMWEPRGHADMYGAIITEPTGADGDFGVIFLHNEGYSTMCGHGIIALTTLVLDTGMIKKEGNHPVVKIDAPPGRVTATGHRENGRVSHVSFLNIPSFLYMQDQVVDVPGIGRVTFDIAFGGAFYAFCCAKDLGLGLNAEDYDKLIDYGRRIKCAVMENFEIRHPFEEDLGFLYGTIFIGDAQKPGRHSRNVCIFAEGELDRSPTGTGVSGRAAIHHAKGELLAGETITIESILGTCMDVKVVETTTFGPYAAVIPEVTGSAYITGRNRFYFDPADPLKNGFLFR